jgi:hypothetical protein
MFQSFPNAIGLGLLLMSLLSGCGDEFGPDCSTGSPDWKTASVSEIATVEELYHKDKKLSSDQLVAFRKATVPIKAEVCGRGITVFYQLIKDHEVSASMMNSLGLAEYSILLADRYTGKGRFLLSDIRPLTLP